MLFVSLYICFGFTSRVHLFVISVLLCLMCFRIEYLLLAIFHPCRCKYLPTQTRNLFPKKKMQMRLCLTNLFQMLEACDVSRDKTSACCFLISTRDQGTNRSTHWSASKTTRRFVLVRETGYITQVDTVHHFSGESLCLTYYVLCMIRISIDIWFYSSFFVHAEFL